MDCEAEKGGALYLEEPGKTYISDCEFEQNEASIDGGAILYNCHNQTENAECLIYIKNGTFQQNSAL